MVTLITPVVPDPTTADISVALFTVYDDTAVPPTDTAVAPVKLVPVMVTVAPSHNSVGENEEIDGLLSE